MLYFAKPSRQRKRCRNCAISARVLYIMKVYALASFAAVQKIAFERKADARKGDVFPGNSLLVEQSRLEAFDTGAVICAQEPRSEHHVHLGGVQHIDDAQ